MRSTLSLALALMLVLLVLLLLLICSAASAAELTGQDKAFFDQHMSDVIKIEPQLFDSPAVKTVFAATFYNVTITIQDGDGGTQTQQVVLVRVGSHLVSATRPSTDADLPDFPKMINSSFKLLTDADGKAMQEALDAAYPIVTDDDKKAAKFTHNGHEWRFIRGKFFDKDMGYLLTTDDSGAITGAKFMLKLP